MVSYTVSIGCRDAGAGPTTIVDKLGSSLQLSVSNVIIHSNNTATPFILTPCLDPSKVNASQSKQCVSLVPADKPGCYVRHYYFYLSAESMYNPRNPTIFDIDASFILHDDTFSSGFKAFESVNYRGWFIQTMSNESVKISHQESTTAFADTASFTLTSNSKLIYVTVMLR